MPFPTEDNIANPYIKMLKNEQNKIKAEKIKSFFSFPGNFSASYL